MERINYVIVFFFLIKPYLVITCFVKQIIGDEQVSMYTFAHILLLWDIWGLIHSCPVITTQIAIKLCSLIMQLYHLIRLICNKIFSSCCPFDEYRPSSINKK